MMDDLQAGLAKLRARINELRRLVEQGESRTQSIVDRLLDQYRETIKAVAARQGRTTDAVIADLREHYAAKDINELEFTLSVMKQGMNSKGLVLKTKDQPAADPAWASVGLSVKSSAAKELTPGELNQLFELIASYEKSFTMKQLQALILKYGLDEARAVLEALSSAKSRKVDPLWSSIGLSVKSGGEWYGRSGTVQPGEGSADGEYDPFWLRLGLKVPKKQGGKSS